LLPAPRDQALVRGAFRLSAVARVSHPESPNMSQMSRRLLLGLGLAGLILENVMVTPTLAADKVSLFKVITTRDEIVIGLSDGELAQLEGGNAGGVAKLLAARGSMSVWQYAVRKAGNGDLEQAPLRQIGLLSNDSLRVEPYSSPLKIIPIGQAGAKP